MFLFAAAGRKEDVDSVFKNAASMGMTAARTWAHSITDKFPFQTAPGKYDEEGLKVGAKICILGLIGLCEAFGEG